MFAAKKNTTTSTPQKNSSIFFQPKLSINQPNDIYEQEADAVADKIMRMPANNEHFFSAKPLSVSRLQRKCAHCEEEEKKIQKKPGNEIIQRDDNETSAPKDINDDPETNPFKLKTTFRPQLNYMPVGEELNYRGVPFGSSYYDDSNLEFVRQYQFYKSFGLGRLAQKAGEVPVLKLIVPDLPGNDPDAALANLTTPMSVGSALRRDNPLETETDSTNMHLFNLKTIHFDLGGGGSVRRKCAHCEDEEKKMQRKESNNEASFANTSTEDYVSSLNGKGRSLTQSERSFFEPRFGYDFSKVQLHTNGEANQSAKSINALAYTHGNNVVFDSNKYQPDTDNGKKLMAHELTHVVQQNTGLNRKVIQRFPWPYPLHMNKEVDENIHETITNAAAPNQAWNGNFNWESKFRIQLNAMIGQIWLVMRLSSTAPRNLQRQWERAIYNKWSGNKYIRINIPGLTGGPCKFLVRVDIRWVADPAKAHYTITPKAPGDNCNGRAGVGGTCSMIDWGTIDNTDITHEFGHMIGNTEEYFTTNGQNFATGGRAGFRDPGAGVMNNPADRAFIRHFNLLKNQVADILRLKHSDVSIIYNNEAIPDCIPDIGDFPEKD